MHSTQQTLSYRELAQGEAIVTVFPWAEKFLHFGSECFTAAAFDDAGQCAGFLSVYPRALIGPLKGRTEGYIDVIEVSQAHRRQGVATALLALVEAWGQERGHLQLRAWSTVDKTEAIAMWRTLGYGLCPETLKRPSRRRPPGYYVTKRISS